MSKPEPQLVQVVLGVELLGGSELREVALFVHALPIEVEPLQVVFVSGFYLN